MNAAIELDPLEFSTPPIDIESERVTKQVESRSGRLLRYKADRRAVTFVTVLFAAHAAVYFFASTWVAAFMVLPLAAASMFVSAINHISISTPSIRPC